MYYVGVYILVMQVFFYYCFCGILRVSFCYDLLWNVVLMSD